MTRPLDQALKVTNMNKTKKPKRSVKHNRQVHVDLGHGPAEHQVTAKVIYEQVCQSVFGEGTNTRLLVEIPGGERLYVAFWKEIPAGGPDESAGHPAVQSEGVSCFRGMKTHRSKTKAEAAERVRLARCLGYTRHGKWWAVPSAGKTPNHRQWRVNPDDYPEGDVPCPLPSRDKLRKALTNRGRVQS